MSLTRPRRSTSAAVPYNEAEVAPLRASIEELTLFLVKRQISPNEDWKEDYSRLMQSICYTLRADNQPNKFQDAFRNLRGFELVLELITTATNLWTAKFPILESIARSNGLVQDAFKLLTMALKAHRGNRKYFQRREWSGGWPVLQSELDKYLERHDSEDDMEYQLQERLFGELLACSVENDCYKNLFLRLADPKYPDESSNINKDAHLLSSNEELARSCVSTRDIIYNPALFPVMLELWLQQERSERPQSKALQLLPTILRIIASATINNLHAVHKAGLLTSSLEALGSTELSSSTLEEVQKLSVTLLELGISALYDADLLYGKAASSPLISKTLSQAMEGFNGYPYIHFDLSFRGFTAIELPDLGRTFPPPSSVSGGYTLSLWLQIVNFDALSHTTIFGALDATQTCFVLVYLEKDTHNLILQTSVTSPRPSVRFKSFEFQTGKWYHVCLVHRRPGITSSSRASLFVDGEFVEQVKAHFPSPPPAAGTAPESSDIPSPGRKHGKVQCFLGTPQDLASKSENRTPSLQWRLGAACLLSDALSDDLIAVHRGLGPRYYGNFQDCLGSFQTYEASASLNLRNETLNPGKEEKSLIVAAIRSKAGNLLPESKFLLNVSPGTILGDLDQVGLNQGRIVDNVSKNASKNLRHWARMGRDCIMVNGSIPSISKALIQASGTVFLTGGPTVIFPQALDDAAWQLGGTTGAVLALVEAADSDDDLLRALDILFNIVRRSWRNSEAMERENGFSILGSLLSSKLVKITDARGSRGSTLTNNSNSSFTEEEQLVLKVLIRVLSFVGYDPDSPENSVINNALAYRILLVDLDIWRSASPEVQKLYYQQFTVFAIGSKQHLFNARRLARMRITKKWLSALKGDTLYPETLDYFLTAFRSILNDGMTADIHRSIALHITYSVHKTKDRNPGSKYGNSSSKSSTPLFGPIIRRSTAPVKSPGMYNSESSQSRALTRAEVGIKVLELYADLLCQHDTTNIKKFARTVTNKWLLYLLAEEDPSLIILASKIIARVLIVSGQQYVDKFATKTGGFIVMQHRLKRVWSVPAIWVICFAILFGRDISRIDLQKPFDLYTLMSNFPQAEVTVFYPQIVPVIAALLQAGLKAIIQSQPDPASPPPSNDQPNNVLLSPLGDRGPRNRAASLQNGTKSPSSNMPRTQLFTDTAKVIQTVTRFMADLHTNSQSFRDFAISSIYVQELLFVLFPLIVSSDIVSPETELNSKGSELTFEGHDVLIRSASYNSQRAAPIVRTRSVESTPSPEASKAKPLKRGSSYILVTSEEPQYRPSSAKLEPIASPKKSQMAVTISVSHRLVQEILEIIVAVLTDQIIARKDFVGLGLFMKVPPGFQEHQAYFQSFILRNTIINLENSIKLNQGLLSEPRVLINLQKFCVHLDEAVFEGWFIDGGDIVIDFLGELLEYLQRPDVQQLKSVRLCSEVIASMRSTISRIALLRLSEPDDSTAEVKTVALLKKLTYWQTVLFAPASSQDEFLKLFCYLLYTNLISEHHPIRDVAANLWRTMLVQKPEETSDMLQCVSGTNDSQISSGFQKVLEVDNDVFLMWIDDHRADLDAIFIGKLVNAWESFTLAENRAIEDNYKTRIIKRREKLRVWAKESLSKDEVLRRHEISAEHWKANIYSSEHLKRQRAVQDQQDGLAFNMASWATLSKQMRRPLSLVNIEKNPKWQLDMTESRNRMRMRMIPDEGTEQQDFKPKRSTSKGPHQLEIRPKVPNEDRTLVPSPISEKFSRPETQDVEVAPTPRDQGPNEFDADEDFEIVDEPDMENFEDKNRKVMRSLQRGDQVEYVHNVSRIVGLEACEGLLIVGKNAFYLMDSYFQRSDGEIVDVWQAPADERDSYMQLISGRQAGNLVTRPTRGAHQSRSWRWDEVLSISRRRFLFRDVALEVFFLDGQSYLLTVSEPRLRDDLYHKLLGKAQTASSTARSDPEDLWRVESLRSVEDTTQSFGSRFTNVFTQGTANPATKKWMKGEISNFQYLMLVNTMAGRTFNDLTQYPVFPWVLADYTSQELDLTNPRSFRDLTKPMGAQNPDRQAEFRDRYQSFAEMGDQNAPPFHYGTHYSSAMIVTGYLIRLQPFVQSYLLLQGGSFDHPDRLFYSIEKAWTSASRDNMTDVRELIPEFFYLPDMFLNGNCYDFGTRQGGGGSIDNVVLPPWAKGNPKIFVAKHREALESDYVSRHLHHWIDLVFGHKQRGEAALEATNVFHHLSYKGAKNLDDITDPVERLATIGIIHNFGQTPHQIFQRAHPAKEAAKTNPKRLDVMAETLTRVPFPVLESKERVATLIYSEQRERLLCTNPMRLNVPPYYDKYMEWGFIDDSLRFYQLDNNKLAGLFEHVHQRQVSTATFVDSNTLVTASVDCTITIWTVSCLSKTVEIVPKSSLFGHRAPVTHLAVSKSCSSLLSCSTDSAVLLWDLNRLELIRVISMFPARPVDCACINDVTGTILLCRGPNVLLCTLNGEYLLDQRVCTEGDESVTCCAFFEGSGNEFLTRNLIFTGHKHGVVNVWNMTVHDGRFVLEHVKRLNHIDSNSFNISATITAVLPMAQVVYTGDEDGRVYEWNCLPRQ